MAAGTRWGVVFLAVGAGFAAALQVGKVPASLPAIRAELGLGLVTAGWVISLFSVIGAAFALWIGAFADSFGHRRMLLFGLVWLALASLAGAFADSAATILASRFVEGTGAIVVMVAAPALIARVAAEGDLKLAFGIWGAYMPAGIAAMVLLTPAALDHIGWRGLWIANAAVLVVFAAILALATRGDFDGPPPRRPKTVTGATVRSLAADIRLVLAARGPLALAFAFATYTANYQAVLGFLPTFLMERQGLGAGAAATLTAVAVAINIVGNLSAGWLLHRGAPRWALIAIASLTMAAAGFGIYAEEVPGPLRYGFCLLFSCVGGLLPASILGGAPVYAPTPAHVGTTNGLIVQGSNVGQLAGPPLLAALVAGTGVWHSAPWLVAALALLGFAISLRIRAHERRRGAAG